MKAAPFRKLSHKIRGQAVVNDFGRVERHLFSGLEVRHQRIDRFFIKNHFSTGTGIISSGKGPDDLFEIGDIDVVIQDQILRCAHAGLGFQEYLPDASA